LDCSSRLLAFVSGTFPMQSDAFTDAELKHRPDWGSSGETPQISWDWVVAPRNVCHPSLSFHALLISSSRFRRRFTRILCQPRYAKPYYVAWNFCRRVSPKPCRLEARLLMGILSILTVHLMMYRIRGAILIGIFLVSIISWPRSTPVTLFPHTEAGDSAFNFFKEVVAFKPLKKVANVINVSGYSTPEDHYLTVFVVWCLWKPQGMVCFDHHALCRYSW
jgi:hypothetical protein